MADGARYNFGMQRNEDYLRIYRFRPRNENGAIDITGWSFSFRVKAAAGNLDPPLLQIGMAANGNGSILTIEDASNGELSVFLKKEDIASLPGRKSDISSFAYNLLATDIAGIRRAEIRGLFVVEPGV